MNDQEQYTHGEKLAMVSQGLMDPKEVGLTSEEDAQLEIREKQSPEEQILCHKMAGQLALNIFEVPQNIRAQWAMSDLKVQPEKHEQTAWLASWVAEHQADHLIQAKGQCGMCQFVMEILVTDPVRGVIGMMRKCAEILDKRYDEQLRLEKEAAAAADTGEQSPEVNSKG